MIKRKLSKTIIDKEEYQIWNSFIDLLATESEEDLSEIQKNAQRAFYYESEIQNGGHLQYFENHKMDNYSDLINSLKAIGANDHAMVLSKALEVFHKKKRNPITSILDFVKRSKEEEYDTFDSEYYNINPDLNHYLAEYLKQYQNEFIEIE